MSRSVPTKDERFIEKGAQADYLTASLQWSGLRWWTVDHLLMRALSCFRGVIGGSRGFDFGHIPLSLVVDVYGLVVLGERAPFASDVPVGQGASDAESPWMEHEDARRLLLDYENRVLSRLLAEPTFREARSRMQVRPSDSHEGVDRLVEFVIDRLAPCVPEGARLHPARVRALHLENPDRSEVANAVERVEDADAPFALDARMREFVERVVERMAWTNLLDAADLFELEHWERLTDAAIRTGCRQLVSLESAIRRVSVPRVRPREEFAEVRTEMDDDSVYPKGGFSGLTNRGSFENMVRSELVYMEDGADVSAFDLRFVQNELLYYLRNDGSLRRRRRDLKVIFELADAFDVRFPGWPARYATVVQAMAVRVFRSLEELYQDDAVHTHVLYEEKEGSSETERPGESRLAESDLLQVVLDEEIAKGTVDFTVPGGSLEETRPEHLTHVLAFASDPGGVSEWRRTIEGWRAENLPVVGVVVATGIGDEGEPEADVPVLALPASELTVERLARVTNAAYAHLVGAR